MKVIPIEKRNKYKCYFCGTTKSVKYIVKINDTIFSDKPSNVCCCNKCALVFNDKIIVTDK